MNEISVPNRTIYDCNLFEKGPNMITPSKIILESRDYDFLTNLVRINFRLLQSYLALFEKDCNDIWSDWELTFQSYLIAMTKIIAIISGPGL